MSVSSNKARIASVTKDILVQWERTKEQWHDAKSAEFEAHYIEPLRSSVDSAMDVVDQMDKIISKIRNDCE
jgi:thymidylate synthase